jgi:hypothetical protein
MIIDRQSATLTLALAALDRPVSLRQPDVTVRSGPQSASGRVFFKLKRTGNIKLILLLLKPSGAGDSAEDLRSLHCGSCLGTGMAGAWGPARLHSTSAIVRLRMPAIHWLPTEPEIFAEVG